MSHENVVVDSLSQCWGKKKRIREKEFFSSILIFKKDKKLVKNMKKGGERKWGKSNFLPQCWNLRGTRENRQNVKKKGNKRKVKWKKEGKGKGEWKQLPFFLMTFIFVPFFSWREGCDVECYPEREREVNSPTLLCLNQQAPSLTVKGGKSIPRTLWYAACWTK